MKINPLYSVIIPVKGRLNYSIEAIGSIYKQKDVNISNIEIIVVEEKKPSEIIRHRLKKMFPNIKIVLNTFEDYSGGSRNTGLSVAKGKYIVFLDSDDQLMPDFLHTSRKILDLDNKSSATVGFSNSIFAPEYKIKHRIKLFLLMLIRDFNLFILYLFNNKYLTPAAFYLCQISHMMFKKEAISKMRFDYGYRFGGEDWDFINRVQNKGLIRIIPKIITVFRYSYNSSTVLPINRKMKWQSYLALASKLSGDRKRSVYYKFFLKYIGLFGN